MERTRRFLETYLERQMTHEINILTFMTVKVV